MGQLVSVSSAQEGTVTQALQSTEPVVAEFGLNKRTLDVAMADGTKHRFMFDKYDAFTAELRSQIAKHAKLVDAGEERWQVVAA
jgi:hypothetical protein